MREVVVPAGEGRAVRVKKNERFRVVDVQGGQVGDLFVFVDDRSADHRPADHGPADHGPAESAPADHALAESAPADHGPADHPLADHAPVDHAPVEWMSAEHTRPSIRRLFPRAGDNALTNRRREIVHMEEDRSPGCHDTLYAACDPQRYALLGVAGPHRSCATNLAEAMEEIGEGLPGRPVPVIPQPFNLFMRVEVSPEGSLSVLPATSKAGDSITFRALMDVIVVVSSCPMDVVEISTGGITELLIEIERKD
jgi:uncharacterized protein YcgI (DUF1989 family)